MSPTWGPLSETLLSLRWLWRRPPHPLVAAWQSAVRSRLGDWVAPLRLLSLTPPVDLHTVLGEASDLESALAALAAAPAGQLQEGLEPVRRAAVGCAGWAQDWLRDLAHGDQRALTALANLLRRYHDHAVAPHWNAIRALLDAERAGWGQIMVDRGIDGLLGSLDPRIRWRPPFLDLDLGSTTRRPASVPVLAGRSLVLVPSVFGVDGPHLLRSTGDDSSPWVLVYPALRTRSDATSLWVPDTPSDDRALAKLLGSTRAKALRTIAQAPATTTGLATKLGIALATASHHLTVLRDAHLVTSSRSGTAVVHRITAEGAALLGAGVPAAEATPSQTSTGAGST